MMVRSKPGLGRRDQPSLRDELPLGLTDRGLKPTAAIDGSLRDRPDGATIRVDAKTVKLEPLFRSPTGTPDEFEQFWEYKAPWAAEYFLKYWTTAALRSRLGPLRRFVHMIRQHCFGVLAFVNRLTRFPADL